MYTVPSSPAHSYPLSLPREQEDAHPAPELAEGARREGVRPAVGGSLKEKLFGHYLAVICKVLKYDVSWIRMGILDIPSQY